jgi:hypothetical protein
VVDVRPADAVRGHVVEYSAVRVEAGDVAPFVAVGDALESALVRLGEAAAVAPVLPK